MKCPVCEKENEPNVNFCESCGNPFPKRPNDGARFSEEILIPMPEADDSSAQEYVDTPFTEDPAPVTRAYCESCGKRVAPGTRLCASCQEDPYHPAKKSAKTQWIGLICALVLLLGMAAGCYALLNSDLFNWNDSSANRVEKEKEEEEEEIEREFTLRETEGISPAETAGTIETGTEASSEPDPTESVTVPQETVPPTTEPPTEPEDDPLMYWIENCDKKYLTAADLEGFDAQMCLYARNACYAKSGRQFNSAELKAYFSQFDWYDPTVSPDKFTENMFNAYQSANLNLILTYERDHGYN